jgi:leader peptidase (prepilin peptidase)/N-methyltransferase
MLALPLVFVILDFISMLIFGKAGFGGGDIKLVALIGAALGWKLGVIAIMIGIFAGGGVAILRLLTRNLIWGRKTYMAFGPFLCGGAIVSLIFGTEIVSNLFSNLEQSGPEAVAALIAGW